MARWKFTEKRNLTLFAFSTRMFFMGVEYAVIFPSVWLYLKIFHVEYWYLGLVLSAYNMVGIISTAIVGHLVDVSRKVRFTGFLWNLAEISGNFIYAMPFYVGLPLIGRMIAGFGEGFISAMWGELARVTTTEQRTRYFAILKGSNLLGAAIGPAFNLFLKEINFNIGEWPIDFRTSPGFVMGLIWILVTILMLICVFDLSWELQNNPDYQLLEEEEEITKLKPNGRKKKKKRKKKEERRAKTSSMSSKESPPQLRQTPEKITPPPEKKAATSLFRQAQQQTSPKKTILSIANEAIHSKKTGEVASLEKDSPEKIVNSGIKSFSTDDSGDEQQDLKMNAIITQDIIVVDSPRVQVPFEIYSSSDEAEKPSTPKQQRNPFESSDSTSSFENDLDAEDFDKVTFKSAILDMFTKVHVVVLIYLLFFMYIIHTCLQGISPLIAEYMLSWSETQVSLLYTAWGLEIILVLVVVWLIAPKVEDRIILVCAVMCGCLSSLCFIILSYSKPGSNMSLYSFLFTVLFAGVAISVTVVIGRSLVSKHTKAENQGLVHAILTSFNRLAGLSGPIFGSSLYTHKTIIGWILAVVQVIGLALVLFTYKRLRVEKKPEDED